MRPLELRYRRVLRLLPADYRATWGGEMVDTFLAGMHADDLDEADADLVDDLGRPAWSEVASVAALALRLRLGGAGAAPRAHRWGEAVRFAVLALLLTHVATAVLHALGLIWLARGFSWLPEPPNDWTLVAANLAGLLWVPAFLAFVTGRTAAGRTIAVTAYGVVAICLAIQLVRGPFAIGSWLVMLTVDALMLVGMVAFHADAPPVPRRPWLVAGGVGTAVVTVVHLVQPLDRPPVVTWHALGSVALAVLAVRHLTARDRDPVRALAILLLAIAAAAVSASTLLDLVQFMPAEERAPLLIATLAELVVLLAVAARAARPGSTSVDTRHPDRSAR